MKLVKNPLKILIMKLAELDVSLHDVLDVRYYNHQKVIETTIHKPLVDISFNLADILLIAAATQSNILLSGSSGSGKTYLGELVAKTIFGKLFTRKNITPDMNEQDFMDIDFGAIKEGKRLKEAMAADKMFEHPCIIIDEANRAPPIIQNRLMQILENNIDLKSIKIKAGVPLSDDVYYHWNILTLNYGDEYAGTSKVDRALKDRIILDIPIDNFPPTLDDQIKMIRQEMHVKEAFPTPNSDTVFSCYQALDKIPLSLEAEALILYLSFSSNCVKSKTGSKYGVAFSPQFCQEHDCRYARNPPLNQICPFTFAPSNRILRRLGQVSKGFTLLKHAKIFNALLDGESEKDAVKYLSKINEIEVSLSDVIKIAPLVLHSKISMNREWVLNKFHGNSFLACKFFIKVIHSRLDYFMKNILGGLVKEKRDAEISEKEKGIRNRALRDDFHYKGLIRYVRKYLA